MDNMNFLAIAITKEIDLNKIATFCGIPKKYTWEQPLALRSKILETIYQKSVDNQQQVLVFSFGSIVFINYSHKEEITSFLSFIQSFMPEINVTHYEKYKDEYSLHIKEDHEMELTDEYVVVSEFEFFLPELISTILAKSVALERIEEQLGNIQDDLETIIDRLEKGKLRVGNKELARATAKIVRHEYNTLAYIMILDKPELTWIHSSASQFYEGMMNFFELNDRYNILKSKTDILYHILSGFSEISHSIRGLFVEWIVVGLIVIEVILTVLQILGWIPQH